MKKTVLLRAPILTHSGYGVHARQVAKWLYSKEKELNLDIYCQLLKWGITPWNLDMNDEFVLRTLEYDAKRQRDGKKEYDVTIQLQLPNEWNSQLGKYNIGMTAGVEADKCNPYWVECINKMNLVIVPSTFVKTTFENTGKCETPIYVIPESYPESFNSEMTVKHEFLDKLETSFNFLVVGQITSNHIDADRKNIPYTIKWLAETFYNSPDVGVIIKTNMGRYTEVDYMQTNAFLTRIIHNVKRGPWPVFYLLHKNLSDIEMASLYKHRSIKALISLTHGEGFGLPILEAAASGLPVITTSWSGHMDFLKLGKFISIEYTLADIHPARMDNMIFINGMKWAYPSEKDFKNRVKMFYKDPSKPMLWAKELKNKIVAQYSFAEISKKYDEILSKVLV